MDTQRLERRRQGWAAVLDVPTQLQSIAKTRLREQIPTQGTETERQQQALAGRPAALLNLRGELAKRINGTPLSPAQQAALDRLDSALAPLLGKHAARHWIGTAASHLDPASVTTIASVSLPPAMAEYLARMRGDQSHIRVAMPDRKAEAPTLADAMDKYLTAHASKQKDPAKTRLAWNRGLTRHATTLLQMPVDGITVPNVQDTLERLNDKPVTRDKHRGWLAAVFDYAASKGWRPHGLNPADRKLLSLPENTAKTKSNDSLKYPEVPALLRRLEADTRPVCAAIRLLILTGARTDSIRGMRYSEVDWQAKTWLCLKERMKGTVKASRDWMFVLSDAAMAVLEERKAARRDRDGDAVFPNRDKPNAGLGHSTMIAALHRFGIEDTNHGFRTSFTDWGNSRTNPDGGTKYHPDFVDSCLSHDKRGKTQRAYNRDENDPFELRRPIFDEWGQFCTG